MTAQHIETAPERRAVRRHPMYTATWKGESVSVPHEFMTGERVYCMETTGDCLEPKISPDSKIVVDPDLPLDPGTFVCLWPADGDTPLIKRLLVRIHEAFRPPVHPDSNVSIVVSIEQLNPRKVYNVPAKKLAAIDAVVAVKDENGWRSVLPETRGRRNAA